VLCIEHSYCNAILNTPPWAIHYTNVCYLRKSDGIEAYAVYVAHRHVYAHALLVHVCVCHSKTDFMSSQLYMTSVKALGLDT
jgi:hypothetical protein